MRSAKYSVKRCRVLHMSRIRKRRHKDPRCVRAPSVGVIIVVPHWVCVGASLKSLSLMCTHNSTLLDLGLYNYAVIKIVTALHLVNSYNRTDLCCSCTNNYYHANYYFALDRTRLAMLI